MREYQVQMFRHGHWMRGRIPYCGFINATESFESARELMEKAIDAWNSGELPEVPTQWRILSRKVSEWKPEMHRSV